VRRLTNLIDVAYTIDNLDQELTISIIFSTFTHLRKYEKKKNYFGGKTNIMLYVIYDLLA